MKNHGIKVRVADYRGQMIEGRLCIDIDIYIQITIWI